MKYIKQLFLIIMLAVVAVPAGAHDFSKKQTVDVKNILWGHIKDSYDWHVTKGVIIHLPVIIKTSRDGTSSVVATSRKRLILLETGIMPVPMLSWQTWS